MVLIQLFIYFFCRNSKEKEKWKNVLPKKEKKHVTGIKMNEVPVVIAMTEVLDDSTIEDQIEVGLMIGDLEVVIVDHLVIAMTEVHVISEDPETIVVVLEMIVGLIVEMIERDRGMMIKVDHLGDQVCCRIKKKKKKFFFFEFIINFYIF